MRKRKQYFRCFEGKILIHIRLFQTAGLRQQDFAPENSPFRKSNVTEICRKIQFTTDNSE